VRLSRADFSALRQAIEQAAPPGHDRDMLVLRHLFGRKNMSRREFVEMALPIKDKKTQQLIPTNWNRAQRYVESLRLRTQRAGKQERYATLKARQFGMSRFWLQSGIEFVLRDTTVPALIIADDESNAKKLLEDGKIMCSRLPFKVPRKYENRSQLYFGEPILGYMEGPRIQDRVTQPGCAHRAGHGPLLRGHRARSLWLVVRVLVGCAREAQRLPGRVLPLVVRPLVRLRRPAPARRPRSYRGHPG
jgi:hypothetical protein